MDIKTGLARHNELIDDFNRARGRLSVFGNAGIEDRLRDLRDEDHALLFQLLLHMPCRRHFKMFRRLFDVESHEQINVCEPTYLAKQLAALEALKTEWFTQAGCAIREDEGYQAGKLSEIGEAIHALQFELILHTPCYTLTPYLRIFWS